MYMNNNKLLKYLRKILEILYNINKYDIICLRYSTKVLEKLNNVIICILLRGYGGRDG